MTVALVTGGGGAIGLAVCALLSSEGYQVVAVDRAVPEEALLGKGVAFRCCDVTDGAAVERLVQDVETHYGPITALVNVAGIVSKGSVLALAEDEFDRVQRVNVKGTLLPCQVVGRRMVERRQGSIVNIGSVVGKNGGNARAWIDLAELDVAGNAAYGMSKAAVHVLTAFMAKELAAMGVRVNAVAPGPIATAMTTTFPENLRRLIPLGRMGRPEDVAEAVAFLLSDKAAFISGEIVDVNGAMWCD